MNDEVQHPAKALEGVEPVACLVNADAGAMVWPISDINEAETYCDEGEFPELLYPATTVSALRERIAELESELRRVTTSPPTGSAPCARLCEHMAFQIQAKSDARRIAELEQDAVRGEPVGFVMVPSEPTREMLNAAIDVDSFKLGDISPLGFRCSPQQLFERCYRAMLAAAPKETP